MIYWLNKFKKESRIDPVHFIKVVDWLRDQGEISTTFYGHHEIYKFYKDLLASHSEKESKLLTMTKYDIGKVTFYNIKKKFNNQ